jgi:hypothetical protein
MPGSIRDRFRAEIAQAQSRLVDLESLAGTLDRLARDEFISQDAADSLKVILPEQLDKSRYVLGHLGAHLGIAAVFAFDLVPLPLGTVSRISWVAGSRFVEQLRGSARARVHSLAVFLIAAVPFLGYGAYLLPLRSESSELAFVLANHTWLVRTGRTYEEFVKSAPTPLRKVARWLVRHPESSRDYAV